MIDGGAYHVDREPLMSHRGSVVRLLIDDLPESRATELTSQQYPQCAYGGS
jgi:hypothetical protein